MLLDIGLEEPAGVSTGAMLPSSEIRVRLGRQRKAVDWGRIADSLTAKEEEEVAAAVAVAVAVAVVVAVVVVVVVVGVGVVAVVVVVDF